MAKQKTKHRLLGSLASTIVLVCLVIVGFVIYQFYFAPPAEFNVVKQASFGPNVSEREKKQIEDSIRTQIEGYDGNFTVDVTTGYTYTSGAQLLTAYVPVTNSYSTRQSVTSAELAGQSILLPQDTEAVVKTSLAKVLGVTEDQFIPWDGATDGIDAGSIALIPVDQLKSDFKLLRLDDSYYLDSFNSGAIYREATFDEGIAQTFSTLKLNSLPVKEDTLKVNQTGVTALTRLMMRKLNTVKDPLYFSEYIGDFLSDADITHVSNEVSFKKGCTYSDTLFCSPPEMIEVLKASGVDVVELTGNHNNDVGSQYNTESIELYKSLGWQTIGGGLNASEASKFYVADQKSSKVAMLAYNFPDSPNGGAIATATKAGANSFDFDKIKADIESAKQQSDYVIVNVQFWECYAYPEGYSEFPECDKPIGTQAETFKKIVDLGASMVVGTSAHQPQTYEIYNGAPIYYGLGNLYFDQDRWPGTERGIILTHYFREGNLIQTKLTPTVYDGDYQTRIMTEEESTYLLDRLNAAR